MAEAIELTAGKAYRVRLAGSKRTDPILVEKVENGQVSFRLTWMSKGERVLGKPKEAPAEGIEVIAALDLEKPADPKALKGRATGKVSSKPVGQQVEEARQRKAAEAKARNAANRRAVLGDRAEQEPKQEAPAKRPRGRGRRKEPATV
jgi:hypothetical protein